MNEIKCPFCNDGEFDLVGLKMHLDRGYCDEYESITVAVGNNNDVDVQNKLDHEVLKEAAKADTSEEQGFEKQAATYTNFLEWWNGYAFLVNNDIKNYRDCWNAALSHASKARVPDIKDHSDLDERANFAFENILKCDDESKRGVYVHGYGDGYRAGVGWREARVPEKKNPKELFGQITFAEEHYASGFNDCIGEFLRLNPELKEKND